MVRIALCAKLLESLLDSLIEMIELPQNIVLPGFDFGERRFWEWSIAHGTVSWKFLV